MNKIHKLILVSIGASALGFSGCASEHSKNGINQTAKDVVKKKIDLSHQNQDREISGESIREWKRLSSQFVKTYQAGDYLTAEGLAKQALALAEREFGHKNTITLSSMNSLAALHQARGDYEKAKPLYIETLALRKKMLGKQHPNTLDSMNNLAGLYLNYGHYEKAKSLYIETLVLNKKVRGKQHKNTLNSMNNLALLYQAQGHYEKAELLFIETLALSKKVLGKQYPDTLDSMNNLASLYQAQGRYEKAESLYIETLVLRKKVLGNKHPHTLTSMSNLARLHLNQGSYDKAEPLHIETLALMKKVLGRLHPETLGSMSFLACLYQRQGHYEKAELLFIETLALNKKVLGTQHPSTLQIMSLLAELIFFQHNYEKAESLYIKVLALRKKVQGKQHPHTLATMNGLAGSYLTQGYYEKAEPLYIETLALRKKVLGKLHPETLASMNNLALLYQAQGHYEKAEWLFVESLALNKKVLGKQHPITINTMNKLAILYQQTQQWNKAKKLFNKYLLNSDLYLQQVLWGAGEKTRLSYLQQEKGFQNSYLSFYNHLIITLDIEKANLPLVNSILNALNPPHLAQQAWKISVSRKGLLLRIASEASALSKLHQASDPQLAKLSQQIQQTRSEIAALTFAAQPNPKQQTVLGDQLNTLQRQLSSKVSQFRDKTKTIQPENILSALTPQQAVVDFLIYKEVDVKTGKYKTERLLAFVASQEQGVKFINLGELAPITQLIQNYRGAVEYKPNNPTWFASKKRKTYLSKTSQALYKKLWQPLTNALGNKKQIYLIPDGALHLLPFKALQNEHAEDLGQQVALTRLGSARDIVFPQQAVKTNASTIMANPVYAAQADSKKPSNRTISQTLRNLSFGSLPGTKTESESIQKTMQQLQQPVNVYTETQASETTIKKEKSPRILHIATHGFFLEKLEIPEDNNLTRGIQYNDRGKMAIAFVENPLARSGLAFTYANQGIKGTKQADGSDGVLTAQEVIDLNLEGTELVTLSACETGVGEISVGEGVYSLNRAFQEAGAKTVLSTLWKISDEGTNLFMQKFYQRFLNNKSAQQALHETQEAFKNSEEWKDPFYWAAFVVTGE